MVFVKQVYHPAMWSEDKMGNNKVPVRESDFRPVSESIRSIDSMLHLVSYPPPPRVGRNNRRTMQNIFPNVKVKKGLDYTLIHAKSYNCRCTLAGANKNNYSLTELRYKIKPNPLKILK